MLLMRLGPRGGERPVVRVSGSHHVEVADAVADFDGAFFADDGVEWLRKLVGERVSAGSIVDALDHTR